MVVLSTRRGRRVDAIGLELDIRIKRQPAKRNGKYSPLKVHSTI
jgi:hypothetical protein